MEKISDFNNKFAKSIGNHTFKSGASIPVFEISSYHSLVQFIGYAKYKNRSAGNVYLRGQHKIYDSLIPSVFRSIATNGGFSKRNIRISSFVKACSDKMELVNKLPELVKEPILQHYGIGTRWIDLVDNIWIAIWFGLYNWDTFISEREYKNITPRTPGNDEWLYIFLICTDGIHEDKEVPGLYKGEKTYTVDLRKAAPSIFLRPHAQHALLMRSKKLASIEDMDLSGHVVGIAKIRLEDGFKWIGENGLTSARNIFPPVNFDQGYGILLENAPHETRLITRYGSIYSVSY